MLKTSGGDGSSANTIPRSGLRPRSRAIDSGEWSRRGGNESLEVRGRDQLDQRTLDAAVRPIPKTSNRHATEAGEALDRYKLRQLFRRLWDAGDILV